MKFFTHSPHFAFSSPFSIYTPPQRARYWQHAGQNDKEWQPLRINIHTQTCKFGAHITKDLFATQVGPTTKITFSAAILASRFRVWILSFFSSISFGKILSFIFDFASKIYLKRNKRYKIIYTLENYVILVIYSGSFSVYLWIYWHFLCTNFYGTIKKWNLNILKISKRCQSSYDLALISDAVSLIKERNLVRALFIVCSLRLWNKIIASPAIYTQRVRARGFWSAVSGSK